MPKRSNNLNYREQPPNRSEQIAYERLLGQIFGDGSSLEKMRSNAKLSLSLATTRRVRGSRSIVSLSRQILERIEAFEEQARDLVREACDRRLMANGIGFRKSPDSCEYLKVIEPDVRGNGSTGTGSIPDTVNFLRTQARDIGELYGKLGKKIRKIYLNTTGNIRE